MKHLKLSVFALVLAFTFVLPTVSVLAAGVSVTPVNSDDPKQSSFQLVPCSGVASASSTNPANQKECDFGQLIVLFQRIVSFLLYLSIPLVLGMIMYTAFKFLTANGDPGKLVKAKQMLIPVAIGLFWILGAYIVVYTVLDNLLQDKLGSTPKENVIFLNGTLKP